MKLFVDAGYLLFIGRGKSRRGKSNEYCDEVYLEGANLGHFLPDWVDGVLTHLLIN